MFLYGQCLKIDWMTIIICTNTIFLFTLCAIQIILEHTQGCKEASITYYEVSLHHTKGTHIKCLNPGWWEWLTDMWVEYSPELWSLVQVVAEIIVITAPVVIGLPLLGI